MWWLDMVNKPILEKKFGLKTLRHVFLNEIECVNLGKYNRLFVVVICIYVKYLLTYQLFFVKINKIKLLKNHSKSVLNCQLCKKI